MERKREASRCRQRIANCLVELGQLANVTQGWSPLVRGSLYSYRRRCGKRECRCSRGELHVGQAFSVSEGGRSRVVSTAGLDRAEVASCVRAHREFRRARSSMVRTFRELLGAVDRMARLREVGLEGLRRRPQR